MKYVILMIFLDDLDIFIIGENEKRCGEIVLFEVNVEKVKFLSWFIIWQKCRGDDIKCIDISKEKYSGSIKRKFVIKFVCKEDDGEYQVVFLFGLNGFDYRFKNIICFLVLEGKF